MDDVIENCATTFEEDGVNQQTLDDIRKVRIPSSCVQHVSITASIFHLCHHAQAGLLFTSSVTLFHVVVVVLCVMPLSRFWRSGMSLKYGVGRRGRRILSAFGGNAQHLTLFVAAPHSISA